MWTLAVLSVLSFLFADTNIVIFCVTALLFKDAQLCLDFCSPNDSHMVSAPITSPLFTSRTLICTSYHLISFGTHTRLDMSRRGSYNSSLKIWLMTRRCSSASNESQLRRHHDKIKSLDVIPLYTVTLARGYVTSVFILTYQFENCKTHTEFHLL